MVSTMPAAAFSPSIVKRSQMMQDPSAEAETAFVGDFGDRGFTTHH
jgi:hypothetical protein